MLQRRCSDALRLLLFARWEAAERVRAPSTRRRKKARREVHEPLINVSRTPTIRSPLLISRSQLFRARARTRLQLGLTRSRLPPCRGRRLAEYPEGANDKLGDCPGCGLFCQPRCPCLARIVHPCRAVVVSRVLGIAITLHCRSDTERNAPWWTKFEVGYRLRGSQCTGLSGTDRSVLCGARGARRCQ